MNKNTKIKRVKKGDKVLIPLDQEQGFANIVVEEDCLVVLPSPEDKKGVVVSDQLLKGLGYFWYPGHFMEE